RELQLERAPRSLEHARVQLAEDARLQRRGLARVQQRVTARLELGRDLERTAQRLDRALRVEETAFEDRAEVDAFVRELAGAARQVDARDLEQPDRGCAGIDVVPDRVDEARQERRAEHREVGGDRLGQAERIRVR